MATARSRRGTGEDSGALAIDPTPQQATTGWLVAGEEAAQTIEDTRAALDTLTVTADVDQPAPVPYERDSYDGSGWHDSDGDCINTRHEVLAAESVIDATIENCQLTAGRWIDWITGQTLDRPDHPTHGPDHQGCCVRSTSSRFRVSFTGVSVH